MVIRQTSPELISPATQIVTELVADNPGTEGEETHRDLNFYYSEDATYHKQYRAFGADLPATIVSQSPPDAIDITSWPIIRRNTGINELGVLGTFTNGVLVSTEKSFDFRTFGGAENFGDVITPVAGSLFDVTFDAVAAVAEQLLSNQMWDSYGQRAQTSAIPHAHFTGHVWNGGWGGAGLTPSSGRRFMAITKRHLFACGHYQYYPGEVLYWKDVNNNIVSRVVQHTLNIHHETQGGSYVYDMSITLLTSDLPNEIFIPPVRGDWGRGDYGVTESTWSLCRQVCGLALLNNDGHIQPISHADKYDTTGLSQHPINYEGITLRQSDVFAPFTFGPLHGSTYPFCEDQTLLFGNHNLRGGDSGSPIMIPCAEGWCYGGHTEIGTAHFPKPDVLNQLIDLVDTRAGVSTGYTVTVATDPTA